jgi:hypothetical protein
MASILEDFAVRLGITGADKGAADVAKLDKSMDKAEDTGRALDVAIGNLAANLGGKLLEALGQAVAWVGNLVPEFAELGHEIGKTSTALGVTTDDLQRLRFAGKASGVELAQLDDSIAKLKLQLEQARQTGTGPLVDAFDTLGVSIDDVLALNTEDQFGLIADSLAEIQDPGQRAALTMLAFGDGNKTLNGLLEKGSAGIRELGDEAEALGGVLGKDAVEGAEALAGGMLRLDTMLGGLKAGLAQELVPLFEQGIAGITGFVEANRELIDQGLDVALDLVFGAAEALQPALEGIGDVLITVLPLVGQIVDAVLPAVVAIGELVGMLANKLQPSFEKLARSLEPVIEILGERLTEAVVGLEGPLMAAAASVEFFVDVLVLWIDTAVEVYRWLEDTAEVLEGRFPKAWAIATKVVQAFIHPVDTARAAIAGVFNWIEKAVSKIGWLAEKVREIKRSLGLGTGEAGNVAGAALAAAGAKPKAEAPAAAAPTAEPAPWDNPQAKAERARVRAEAEAKRASAKAGGAAAGGGGGRGAGGSGKPKAAEPTIEELIGLGGSLIPDSLGGGRGGPAGPSLIRIDASYHAPTTITLQISGVDLSDPDAVGSLRRDLAGELGADLAERDRRAFDRYQKVLV